MREDLIGRKYGRLTVVELDKARSKRKSYWVCQCECGSTKTVRSDSLKAGAIRSCGCLHNEQAAINVSVNHSHKMSKTRLYHTWQGMKKRCNSPDDASYPRYGGRGITVCKEWESSFESFMEWALNNGYADNLTIDRVDNNGNYGPSNCRWTEPKSQARNRRSNIKVRYNGKVMTLIELSEATGLSYSLLSARYDRGDRGKRLVRPSGEDRDTLRGAKNHNNKINEATAREIKQCLSKGEVATIIARDLGISKHIVYDIKQGRTWNWL